MPHCVAGVKHCLTQDLLAFQRFLEIRQNEAQTANVLQKVQSDQATAREDRPRQQRVSSDLVIKRNNDRNENSGLMFFSVCLILKGN